MKTQCSLETQNFERIITGSWSRRTRKKHPDPSRFLLRSCRRSRCLFSAGWTAAHSGDFPCTSTEIAALPWNWIRHGKDEHSLIRWGPSQRRFATAFSGSLSSTVGALESCLEWTCTYEPLELNPDLLRRRLHILVPARKQLLWSSICGYYRQSTYERNRNFPVPEKSRSKMLFLIKNHEQMNLPSQNLTNSNPFHKIRVGSAHAIQNNLIVFESFSLERPLKICMHCARFRLAFSVKRSFHERLDRKGFQELEATQS